MSWALLARLFSVIVFASLGDRSRRVGLGRWGEVSQIGWRVLGRRHCCLEQVIPRVEERMWERAVFWIQQRVVFGRVVGSSSVAAGRRRVAGRSTAVVL